MPRWFHKGRKYPIKYDELGRSARQQAFALFRKEYRPSQIFKEKLIPVPMKTLTRYFEDYKKGAGLISRSDFKKFLKNNPEYSEHLIEWFAEYLGVSTNDIILRMQKPWGIINFLKGELFDNRRFRLQSELEDRLGAALRLINFGEQAFHNSPKQVHELAWEISTLKDNTRLVIEKTKGQVTFKKESL